MNIEKERELFEAFYLKEFGDDYTCPYAQLDKRGGEYIDFHAQDTWVTWLASRNREGYVLVPVIANKKMLKAGYDAHDEFFFDSQVHEVYKAMIGACDE